jgi:methyltransferase (TIGR00027 family)
VKEDRSSDTALGASVIRTVHQLLDDRPLILDDPVSPKLLAMETIEAIRANPDRHRKLQARGLRSHIVLRSRYAEDRLQEAVQHGVLQFINVGAGFDTFAFRQPMWARELQIIEVDHPASQQAKLAYFANRGLLAPANTRFVPLDLEKGNLLTCLVHNGVDLNKSTFFACLGVLAYLTPAAVRKVLEDTACLSEGSSIVLAFAPKDSNGKESEAAERAAQYGEPWLMYFTTEEMEGLLKTSGFSSVEFLSPETAAGLYYKGRSDLPAPRKTRICMARA